MLMWTLEELKTIDFKTAEAFQRKGTESSYIDAFSVLLKQCTRLGMGDEGRDEYVKQMASLVKNYKDQFGKSIETNPKYKDYFKENEKIPTAGDLMKKAASLPARISETFAPYIERAKDFLSILAPGSKKDQTPPRKYSGNVTNSDHIGSLTEREKFAEEWKKMGI